jgi:large subunit ribosomal protein L1
MAPRSRRYEKALQIAERGEAFGLEEAIEKILAMPAANFDETVECHVQLGIDPRHSDQQVRGSITLPHGTGSETRVAVFAEGADADAAREAGADIVGSDELAEQIEDGFLDFDVCIATPNMMSKVGRLGRILGPRGMMPSPKSGTVRPDIAAAVEEFKAGKLEFRNDSGGNVHVPIGKRSFQPQELVENAMTLLETLLRMKPMASKGRYFRKVCVTSTMSPAVQVEFG